MASLCKKCKCGRGAWDTCDHVWLIRYRRGSGKEQYLPAGHNRRGAERRLAELDRKQAETVSDAIDIWLEHQRIRGRKPGSLQAYEVRAKIVREALGHQPVQDVTPDEVRGFAQGLTRTGRAADTCRGICSVLMASLRHAAARGVIHQLPAPPEGLGLPAPAAREHTLTVGEILGVIERMPRQWGLLAELCLLTGLRIGEAMALTPDVVGTDVLHVRGTLNRQGSVNSPKTRRSERLIMLDERAQLILKELHLPVAMSYTQARRVLDEALGPLKQPGVGWHVFRHAHAALLEQDGASLREIAERLGHGHNYTVTLGYTLKSQSRAPRQLGELLRQHETSDPSGGSGQAAPPPDELAARRAARAQRGS